MSGLSGFDFCDIRNFDIREQSGNYNFNDWLLFSFSMSRILRAAVLTLRESPFVEAARALGADGFHIVFRHLLPNVVPVILSS